MSFEQKPELRSIKVQETNKMDALSNLLQEVLPLNTTGKSRCTKRRTAAPEVQRSTTTIRMKTLFRLELKWNIISLDRKSTRLNSSHVSISYAVFCLKKK